jgi:hypothetical protein
MRWVAWRKAGLPLNQTCPNTNEVNNVVNSAALFFRFNLNTKPLNVAMAEKAPGEIVVKKSYSLINTALHQANKLQGHLLVQCG